MFSARCISACLRRIRLRCEFSASLVLMVTATSLVAAPPEPIQKPVKLLGLGEGIDGEFAKLTDVGIIPSLGYYSVFQGNPVGSALLVSSPSVFLSTLPVVLPFLFVSRAGHALRVSNLVAIGLLFLAGYVFGRNIGHNAWRLGIVMVLIGCFLAGVAISLGGRAIFGVLPRSPPCFGERHDLTVRSVPIVLPPGGNSSKAQLRRCCSGYFRDHGLQ